MKSLRLRGLDEHRAMDKRGVETFTRLQERAWRLDQYFSMPSVTATHRFMFSCFIAPLVESVMRMKFSLPFRLSFSDLAALA